jgi:hypothetical protein
MSNIFSPDRGALRAVPAERIVASIADAAERWADADFPPRVRVQARIEARLRYTTPVVDFALDALFDGITAQALRAIADDELGGFGALDGFVPRAGRPDGRARAIGRALVIASSTTIGVAIPAAVFALCAKCDVVVKDRSDGLVAEFFETLAQERPEFARAARAVAWTGGADAQEAALLADADVVVAYGDDPSLAAIRSGMRPGARFVGFGNRASIAYLSENARGAIHDEELALLARDALLYDGDGCLSLHALFVERPDRAFLERLGAAVARAAVEFPLGEVSAQRKARMAQAHDHALFNAAIGRGTGVVVDGGNALVHLTTEAPAFAPRVLSVVAVDRPDDAATLLATWGLPLEAIALASVETDAAARGFAETCGAVRVTRFGGLQRPPLAGNHGGEPCIAPFVRWIERG